MMRYDDGTPRRYYNPAEVAEVLGVTRRTVYTWIRSGILPAIKSGPKLWLVSEELLGTFERQSRARAQQIVAERAAPGREDPAPPEKQVAAPKPKSKARRR